MSYYLQLDGIDDKFVVPGSNPANCTAFEMDFVVEEREDWHQIANLGGKLINYSAATNNIVFHADFLEVTMNGVPVTSGTAFMTLGQRYVMRGTLKAGITAGATGSAFLNNTVTQFTLGKLYYVKLFQAGDVLAAHYDFTTGTANDQTGNGYTPQLTGGTWVNENDGYLEMDGVDDILKMPVMTFNRVDVEYLMNTTQPQPRYALLDLRNGGTAICDSAYQTGGTFNINGGLVNHAGLGSAPLGVRQTVRFNVSTVTTDDANIFSWNDNTKTAKGRIYTVKFYNAGSLVASYDMRQGNAQDISGNGYHATLTGGTFVPESGGGGAHPVTASASAVFSASATVVRNRFVSATASFVTSAAATLVKKRFISASAQAVFSAAATVIKSGGNKATSGTATFTTSATATVVRRAFKTASAAFVTSASATVVRRVHVTASADMRFTATLFQGTAIIADETLRAERALYATLRAERSLFIELRGDIMTARNQNIELYAGESRYTSYPTYDEQGEPLDLTGGAINLVVSRRGVEAMTKGLPILGSSFTLSLTPADTEELATGIYYYKATFTDGIGNVSVLAEGDLTIKR